MVNSDATTFGGAVWELFLDDHVIERSTGFRRVLHHPHPRGVVLPADKPWETLGTTPLYVGRRKDGTLECYYRAHWWEEKADAPASMDATAYAVSDDGIHWEKPVLNMREGPLAVDRASRPHWMVEDRWGRTHLEEGFGFEDCQPVCVNSIEHTVQFNSAKLATLKGKTVRLFFKVEDADLYGFRFK